MARKILLADDSVTAQNMGRKILADAGYEVITVNNGSAALKKITEQHPDLIVLDVYMPGYSGLEVCQRLKESSESARIPILLTVGKLEPFKPDEAKRVRADAFIVKPFEASELLSALSKLEDRIVPRADSAKPGRFARTIAAVEEIDRGRNESPADDDNGWKNRIAFPSKKKKQEEEPLADDAATYNAKNDDLRTIVDHSAPVPVQPSAEFAVHPLPPQSQSDDARVDVAALATPGLPSDVTAEELAAIAAAAAKVQQAVASVKDSAEPISDSKPVPEPPPTSASPSQPLATSAQPSAASTDSDSSNGAGRAADEDAAPVTMAVASPVELASGPRWTAVAVALDASESTLSLEQEMQRSLVAAIMESPQTESTSVDASFAPPAAIEPESDPNELEKSGPAESALSAPELHTENAAPAPEPTELAQSAPPFESEAGALNTAVSDPPAETQPANSVTQPDAPAETIASQTAAVANDVAADETPKIEAQASVQVSPEIPPVQEKKAEHLTDGDAESAAISSSDSSTDVPMVQPETPVVAGEASAVPNESAIEGAEDMAEKKESELAAKTAAAWATWRQIRDTKDSSKSADVNKENFTDQAAMAVAAGAEKSPEASTEESPEIASIVDSVLADLRPKIVEEISRKMGKKK